MFYLIDEFEQGTQEWREWRKGVVGASDAPTIMGENPWASKTRLLEEKLGVHKEFEGNAATREGQRLEGPARSTLESQFKQKLSPTIVQDAKEPFLAASLDAIDQSRENIYEIKCGARTYEQTLRSNTVPEYYRAQLQHILMITELETIIFAAYRPGVKAIILKVTRDNKYIKKLRIAELEFIKELERHGHNIQYEFKGVLVH